MTKLIRYLICVNIVLIKTTKLCFIWIIRHVVIILRIIQCVFLLKKTSEPINAEYDIGYYYCDRGKLSDNQGYYFKQTRFDLSIIIPFYNADKYIEECLNSILSQKTDFSYEIILVDDGSEDGSLTKINGFLNRTNIKLIKQENAGQSVARNKALQYTCGIYLMFVDADDVLLPNAIESLMIVAKETNSDIVEGSIVRFYNQISDEMIKESRGKSHIESNSKNPKFVLTSYGYSWAKVYRRELWTTLRFPEGYIFEDVITKYILRRKANQVAYIEDVVYGYRQNSQSSSHGSNRLKKLDSIWVLPKVFELCKQENAPRDDVFYLLSLNHIGLLNYITTKSQSTEIRLSCFAEMRKQLLSIQDCRPKRMPLMFRLLDRSILENKFEAWESIAETIQKLHLLKKWREIN